MEHPYAALPEAAYTIATFAIGAIGVTSSRRDRDEMRHMNPQFGRLMLDAIVAVSRGG